MGQASRPLNVLVVEDDPFVSDVICDSLQDDGFAVILADNADDALRLVREGPPIDAMLTDVNLAGGMDGATLAQLVREIRPEIPIVYSSGYVTESQLRPMVARSMFVAKPFRPAELGVLLRRMTAAVA